MRHDMAMMLQNSATQIICNLKFCYFKDCAEYFFAFLREDFNSEKILQIFYLFFLLEKLWRETKTSMQAPDLCAYIRSVAMNRMI